MGKRTDKLEIPPCPKKRRLKQSEPDFTELYKKIFKKTGAIGMTEPPMVCPFTIEEEDVMNLLIDAHNKFMKLKRNREDEVLEWMISFHRLQDILSNRLLKRTFPKYYR